MPIESGAHDVTHSANSRYPRPTLRDWGLLAISVLFVLAGLLIIFDKPDVGIVTLAFFGTCAAVFISTILQKLRFRRFRAVGFEVAGGVPIRPLRGRLLLLGAWLAILGAVMQVYGGAYPLLFRILAVFVSAIGVAIILGVLTRLIPREFLQFDPDALTIARGRWRARLPWDDIADLREVFLQDNPVLLIAVADFAAVSVDPPEAQAQVLKALSRNHSLYGESCFAVMPAVYGIDLPVLTGAVARYVLDHAARRELGRRALPEARQE